MLLYSYAPLFYAPLFYAIFAFIIMFMFTLFFLLSIWTLNFVLKTLIKDRTIKNVNEDLVTFPYAWSFGLGYFSLCLEFWTLDLGLETMLPWTLTCGFLYVQPLLYRNFVWSPWSLLQGIGLYCLCAGVTLNSKDPFVMKT